MTVHWIRQRFESLVGSDGRRPPPVPDNVARLLDRRPDGRPLSPDTMRLCLRSYAEHMAWVAERRAEAAERARQEAERRVRRVAELDDLQLRREFTKLSTRTRTGTTRGRS